MPGKKSNGEIAKLRSQAKLIGLDVDALLKEISDAVIAQIKLPDMEALAHKITQRVESDFAVKLTELLEDVKKVASPSVDIQAVVQAVVAVLEPRVVEFTQQTMEKAIVPHVERVVQANIPGMIQSIAGQLEERVRQNPPPGATGGGLGAIVNQLPKEFWAGLASRVFGAQQSDLSTLIKGIKLGNSLRQGTISAEDLEKAITPEK